jgi:hypothetical protein
MVRVDHSLLGAEPDDATTDEVGGGGNVEHRFVDGRAGRAVDVGGGSPGRFVGGRYPRGVVGAGGAL